MMAVEYDLVWKAVERMPVLAQVWLLDRRVRVRRITESQWKVIPHDAWGRGDPLRFMPVKTVQEAVKIVVQVSGKIDAKTV